MLVEIQNTTGCPGPWYNGLQLCDHINGSYPVVDGTLAQWRDMLQKIKPMRLMWWNNPVRCALYVLFFPDRRVIERKPPGAEPLGTLFGNGVQGTAGRGGLFFGGGSKPMHRRVVLPYPLCGHPHPRPHLPAALARCPASQISHYNARALAPSRAPQVYWSVQGGVWSEATRSKESSVGKWFSWGPESCAGIPQCDGSNVVSVTDSLPPSPNCIAASHLPVKCTHSATWFAVVGLEQVVPGVGCAQGSWGSKGSDPKTEGVQSALASVGSKAYADYMVDAMTNTWTGNLGIDGYTEDVSCNYGCMLQLTDPEKGSLPDWAKIVKRVRATHPQLVMSGEGYGSWAEMVIADANLGGQGSNDYHITFQKAVTDGDASQLETLASTSGADAASVLCYLNPAYDGLQPGGCPTMCKGRDTNPGRAKPHPPSNVSRAWRWAHSLHSLPLFRLPRQHPHDDRPQAVHALGGARGGVGDCLSARL